MSSCRADSHQLLSPEPLQHCDLKDPHQRALKSSLSSCSCSKAWIVGVCDKWEGKSKELYCYLSQNQEHISCNSCRLLDEFIKWSLICSIILFSIPSIFNSIYFQSQGSIYSSVQPSITFTFRKTPSLQANTLWQGLNKRQHSSRFPFQRLAHHILSQLSYCLADEKHV